MSKGAQIAVAAFTVLLGGAWLIASSSSDEGTFAYYENVAAFRGAASGAASGGAASGAASGGAASGAASGGAASSSQSGHGLRVHGFVVSGSIRKDLAAGHIDFAIADADSPEPMGVRYLGIDVPDLFADGAEVVVEGQMRGGLFHAERVMAKCPSKYEARESEA